MTHAEPVADAAETARLLRAVVSGREQAGQSLVPILYGELRRLAEQMMAGRAGHTLQPTALVHEAWLRIVPHLDEQWSGRRHFLQFAAKAMRSVLVDHARAAQAEKRGGGRQRVTLAQDLFAAPAGPEDLLVVDEALQDLAAVDAQLAQIVELRVFGGLEHREVADSLGISLRSVERGWRLARAWLLKHMGHADGQREVD